MLTESIHQIGAAAKAAARKLAVLSSAQKDKALRIIADLIEEGAERIKSENARDLQQGKEKGLSKALIDRLTLNDQRIKGMADGLRDIANLKDPVGEVLNINRQANGLEIGKVRTPLGVVGIIYESRPNVTVDAAGLCLKSGNAVILRGGSEAINSNLCLADVLRSGLTKAGLPAETVQVISTTDREAVQIMLKMDNYIDIIIPRGGHGLIRAVVENSTIPVIKHDKGVCHTYIHKDAELEMAVEIAFNAKVHRPGVCNAMETLLVHQDIAAKFLPKVGERYQKAGVELRGCERTRAILSSAVAATEDDWYEEYLDLILAVRIVDSFKEAVDHIDQYGSHHSDAIVTTDYQTSRDFLAEVDSAAVYVNASTRFTDGAVFGLGAEIGISTQKLHARGPMGLEELTSVKFIILGNGQIRE